MKGIKWWRIIKKSNWNWRIMCKSSDHRQQQRAKGQLKFDPQSCQAFEKMCWSQQHMFFFLCWYPSTSLPNTCIELHAGNTIQTNEHFWPWPLPSHCLWKPFSTLLTRARNSKTNFQWLSLHDFFVMKEYVSWKFIKRKKASKRRYSKR